MDSIVYFVLFSVRSYVDSSYAHPIHIYLFKHTSMSNDIIIEKYCP